MRSKITPCLWFDGVAEDAANLYVGLVPNSSINRVMRSPADNPSTPKGAVLVVEFTLAGKSFMGLNGGPQFPFTEAVSFVIHCDDQDEVDRLWDRLIENGGAPSRCGWLKDRYGVSWQIVPRVLEELMTGSDRARAERVMQAMLAMVKLDINALLAA